MPKPISGKVRIIEQRKRKRNTRTMPAVFIPNNFVSNFADEPYWRIKNEDEIVVEFDGDDPIAIPVMRVA